MGSFIIGLTSLTACTAPPPVPDTTRHPLHVASINLCADQLVLALLPASRIASVTALARDRAQSVMASMAQRISVNRGSAEEIVRDRPDLVVAGSFTTPATRALLKRLHYPMIEVPSVDDWVGIRRSTRQVAAAVGEQARGEALLARMDVQLAKLAHAPALGVRVAAWDGGGFNARPGSLYDAILRAAGAVNVANQPPVTRYAAPDAEVLLLTTPHLLVTGRSRGDRPGLRAMVADHPALRARWAGRKVALSSAAYTCGTPMAAEAALHLRERLKAAM